MIYTGVVLVVALFQCFLIACVSSSWHSMSINNDFLLPTDGPDILADQTLIQAGNRVDHTNKDYYQEILQQSINATIGSNATYSAFQQLPNSVTAAYATVRNTNPMVLYDDDIFKGDAFYQQDVLLLPSELQERVNSDIDRSSNTTTAETLLLSESSSVIEQTAAETSTLSHHITPDDIMHDTANIIESDVRTLQRTNSDVVLPLTPATTVNNLIYYKSDSMITSTISRKFMPVQKLFRVFSFKGIGLSLVKSVVSWDSFGFGLRIPITPHFPEYDRRLELPRISTFVGVFYPINYRMSVSMSFPMNTALYGLASLGQKYNIVAEQVLEQIKNVKATDSVKRIGLTLTFRYSDESGFRMSLGPWIFYLPGVKTMEKVLPVIFSLPSLLTAILNVFVSISPGDLFKESISAGLLDDSNDEDQDREEQESTVVDDHNTIDGVSEVNDLQYDESSGDSDADNTNKDTYVNNKMRGFKYWHEIYLKWAATKTTGLGCNLGWYKSHADASMGSSVLFDIQPFYTRLPAMIENFIDRFRKLLRNRSNDVTSSSSSGNTKGSKKRRTYKKTRKFVKK